MISYTVDWTPNAENALTDIWLQTFDPAVAAAQARIDRLLASDPFRQGKLLSEELYRFTEHPLTVFYSVDRAQHTVEVSEVWYTP